MSVLIKGMEMPKHCRNCKFSYFTHGISMKCLFISEACKIKGRLSNCPLVAVPTPHGRLIDADTVEKRLQKYWYEEYPNQEASYHRAFMDSNACVKDLPTIIEAEVSEE